MPVAIATKMLCWFHDNHFTWETDFRVKNVRTDMTSLLGFLPHLIQVPPVTAQLPGGLNFSPAYWRFEEDSIKLPIPLLQL